MSEHRRNAQLRVHAGEDEMLTVQLPHATEGARLQRISNASVEGMNRKAKVVSQRAYGNRTFANLRLALYHLMGDLPMPDTTHRFL